MDNNCAAVSFPDFTRGHWNDVKGYKHAYAPEAEEKAVEEAAAAYTANQKAVVQDAKLWDLYDQMKKAEGKAKVKATAAYNKAKAKAVAKFSKVAAKK